MHSPILSSLLRDNPVVITGTGCHSAGGDSVSALWKTRRLYSQRRDLNPNALIEFTEGNEEHEGAGFLMERACEE
jgi:hypothetical protein